MSYPNKFGKNREVDPLWLHVPTVYMSQVKGSKDRGWESDFCVIQFYGNKALCAWRNNERCYTGMPFMCRVVTKNKKRGILYKGKFYPFTKYGWVF